METIIRTTNESDDFILDLSEFIANYFDRIDYELNICSLQEFNEFIHVLKLSSIIIEDAVEENDMELFFEAFYQVQSRFKKENLINQSIFCFNHDFNSKKYELYETKNTWEVSTTLKEFIEVNHVEF